MKTNHRISTRNRNAMAVLLLLSSLYLNPATAQHTRRGAERHATVRDGSKRQNAGREQSFRRQDMAITRNNSASAFNRNRNAATLERNNRLFHNRAGTPVYKARPVNGSVSMPAYRPAYSYNKWTVYNPHNPSWRYGYLPKRNSYFYSLPTSYTSINFGGIGYRYRDGVFYRPYNNMFTVIAPPFGIYLNILPVGYRKIYVRNYPYYYYNGTYYDQRGSNYYVVSPPVGAVVESLPAGYETVVINGETFYTADRAQYKPVVQQNGEIWYEVIKAN